MPAPLTPGTAPSASVQWADSVLRTLSLRDKAAQMIYPWILGDFQGADDPTWQRTMRLVTEQKVGGFIMSIGSPTEIAVKLNALQRLSDVPLLIGGDLESGAAFRARGGYALPNLIDLGSATSFPMQMALGASRDTALAYQMGRITAIEGLALGYHMAYAPVLDVNNNPKNPVIGGRSFGEDPRLVGRLGAAFIRGIQEHGMLATGKHFPGHGDTEQNSHLELSRVTASRARIDTVELAPFRDAIRAGVRGMMTFHGYLPALDTTNIAATLNPRIMNDLLQRDLGFQGLLVTDALDMAGVLGAMGITEVVQRAVVAGTDVLLMPSDLPGAVTAVVEGVRTGRFPESRIDHSVRKLLAAKHELGLHRNRYVDPTRIRDVVSTTDHLSVARQMAERGITLVKDSLSLVPMRGLAREARVVSLTLAPRTDLGAGVTFDGVLRSAFPSLRTVALNPEVTFDVTAGAAAGGQVYTASARPRIPAAALENALRAAQGADIVILSSYFNWSSTAATSQAPTGFTELVDGLRRQGARVVLSAFGNPYLLMDAPSVPAYLIAWGGGAASQRAAARALLGQAPITGKLPTSIPPHARVGQGLERPAVR